MRKNIRTLHPFAETSLFVTPLVHEASKPSNIGTVRGDFSGAVCVPVGPRSSKPSNKFIVFETPLSFARRQGSAYPFQTQFWSVGPTLFNFVRRQGTHPIQLRQVHCVHAPFGDARNPTMALLTPERLAREVSRLCGCSPGSLGAAPALDSLRADRDATQLRLLEGAPAASPDSAHEVRRVIAVACPSSLGPESDFPSGWSRRALERLAVCGNLGQLRDKPNKRQALQLRAGLRATTATSTAACHLVYGPSLAEIAVSVLEPQPIFNAWERLASDDRAVGKRLRGLMVREAPAAEPYKQWGTDGRPGSLRPLFDHADVVGLLRQGMADIEATDPVVHAHMRENVPPGCEESLLGSFFTSVSISITYAADGVSELARLLRLTPDAAVALLDSEGVGLGEHDDEGDEPSALSWAISESSVAGSATDGRLRITVAGGGRVTVDVRVLDGGGGSPVGREAMSACSVEHADSGRGACRVAVIENGSRVVARFLDARHWAPAPATGIRVALVAQQSRGVVRSRRLRALGGATIPRAVLEEAYHTPEQARLLHRHHPRGDWDVRGDSARARLSQLEDEAKSVAKTAAAGKRARPPPKPCSGRGGLECPTGSSCKPHGYALCHACDVSVCVGRDGGGCPLGASAHSGKRLCARCGATPCRGHDGDSNCAHGGTAPQGRARCHKCERART